VVVVLVAMALLWLNTNDFSPEACLGTAEPRLHVLNGDDDYVVFHRKNPATITGDWQALQLWVEWGPESVSERCQQFILEDERVKVFWESQNQNPIELVENEKWDATLRTSASFASSDKIIVSLLYDNQPLDYTFQLNFER